MTTTMNCNDLFSFNGIELSGDCLTNKVISHQTKRHEEKSILDIPINLFNQSKIKINKDKDGTIWASSIEADEEIEIKRLKKGKRYIFRVFEYEKGKEDYSSDFKDFGEAFSYFMMCLHTMGQENPNLGWINESQLREWEISEEELDFFLSKYNKE